MARGGRLQASQAGAANKVFTSDTSTAWTKSTPSSPIPVGLIPRRQSEQAGTRPPSCRPISYNKIISHNPPLAFSSDVVISIFFFSFFKENFK